MMLCSTCGRRTTMVSDTDTGPDPECIRCSQSAGRRFEAGPTRVAEAWEVDLVRVVRDIMEA